MTLKHRTLEARPALLVAFSSRGWSNDACSRAGRIKSLERGLATRSQHVQLDRHGIVDRRRKDFDERAADCRAVKQSLCRAVGQRGVDNELENFLATLQILLQNETINRHLLLAKDDFEVQAWSSCGRVSSVRLAVAGINEAAELLVDCDGLIRNGSVRRRRDIEKHVATQPDRVVIDRDHLPEGTVTHTFFVEPRV